MLDQLEAQARAIEAEIASIAAAVEAGKMAGVKARMSALGRQIWDLAKAVSDVGPQLDYASIDGMAAAAAILRHWQVASGCHDRGDGGGALRGYAEAVREARITVNVWRQTLEDDLGNLLEPR